MNSDSMIFVEKSLDNLISVIELMVNYHIDRKFEDLRNIIIGYDSKNKQWIGRYGQILEKKLLRNAEAQLRNAEAQLRNAEAQLRNAETQMRNAEDQLLNADSQPHNQLHNTEAQFNDEARIRSKNLKSIAYTTSIYSMYTDPENFDKGMMFYEDEYNNVRFHMDESVKRILYVLFTLSDRVIDYRHIIDLIISEWNLKNIADNINPLKMNNEPDICGDLYFHQIEVRKVAWKEFKRLTKQKGVTIRDGFKQAVISFLEDRLPMINNLEKKVEKEVLL